MHRSTTIASFLTLTLTASAIAQTTVVSPRAMATVPAPSANTHPLGTALATSQTMRYMSIHDDMQGQPGLIRGMATRVNEGAASQATNIVMEVRISTAASLAAAAVTTFDTNHGTDKVSVVPANSPFNFPAYPPVTPGPAPFNLAVPFTNNFPFAGTLGIAWEMLIASRTNTTAFSMDAASTSAFTIIGSNSGTGCLATGRTAVASASSSATVSTVTLTSANLTATAPGLIVIGTSNSSWGGIPLPFDIPNTTGYSSGTCRVYSDWGVSVALTSSAAGGLSLPVPFALGAGTLGVRIYHYGLTLDAAANAFGLVTTNSRLTIFGDGSVAGGCRIYAFNDVNALTGTKDATIVVSQFQY